MKNGEKQKKTNPLRWILMSTCCIVFPLLTDLLSWTNFFTGKTSYEDYSANKVDSSDKQHKTPPPGFTPNILDSIRKDIAHTKEKTDSIRDDTKNIRINIDSLFVGNQELLKIIKNQNNALDFSHVSENVQIDLKTTRYEVKLSSGGSKANDSSTMQMSEKPLQKGYGRMAVMSMCKFCSWSRLKIYRKDSIVFSDRLDLYDINRVEETILKVDLRPGSYIAEVTDSHLEPVFFTVAIEDRQISYYKFDRVNPYGADSGQIEFVIKNKNANYRLMIDELEIANIFPDTELPKNKAGDRIFHYNLRGENAYKFTVENLDASDFMARSKTERLLLRRSQKLSIIVH